MSLFCGFWGQMVPEWKLFINLCPKSAFRPQLTCRGQIWQKSAVAKLPKSRLVLLTKKPGVGDTSEPPISPPLSRSRPKFSERCRLLSCACLSRWSWLTTVCRTYSGKSLKSQYNIGRRAATHAGFQKKFEKSWPPRKLTGPWTTTGRLQWE